MKDRKIVFSAALLALACSAASWGQSTPSSGTAQTQQAKQDRLTAARKASTFSGPPVVGEFQGSQFESVADNERRQKREKRYSVSNSPRHVEDPGRFVGGQEEHTALRFIDYVAIGTPIDPRGIPVSNSNAVVIGTVVSGKCFVTGDHTYVYTDYSVRIDEVLKQDPAAIVGNVVVAAREGGAIHFPSGHVTNFLIEGRGLPEIGSQYVLFLWKPIPDLPEYEIIFESGYQIKNGKVYPLDDVNSQYVGVDLPVFLDEVNKAIAASQSKGVGR